MREDIDCRLFLVGCARSGTKLLQSLLAAHPEILSFPESHFFRYLIPYASWRKRLGLARPKIRRHLENFYDEIECGENMRANPGLLTLRMKSYAQLFVKTLDNKAASLGVRCWLEKTPLHLHKIATIERYVPDVKFLHIVRDGRDVVASMHKVTHEHPDVWNGVRSIETCLNRWIGDIETTCSYTGEPHHEVVRYRDVATDPDQTLRQLCAALGVQYTSKMIENYRKEARTVSSKKWQKKYY